MIQRNSEATEEVLVLACLVVFKRLSHCYKVVNVYVFAVGVEVKEHLAIFLLYELVVFKEENV